MSEIEAPVIVPVLAAAGIAAMFDHVAHAAPSLSDLLSIYRDLLGGVFDRGGLNPRFGYRAVQLLYVDGSRIELLEAAPGSDFLTKFFERNPRGGLHHITFKINDLRSAVTALEQTGFEITGAYFNDTGRQEAFLHPRTAFGALVQLVQVEPNYLSPRRNPSLEAALKAG